jgi:hypothetical protein
VDRRTQQTVSFPSTRKWQDTPTNILAVYNCRTSNAWNMDLALTTTYFPHCGLTFAILFGCPLSVEEEIIRRLSFATAEAAHPLLLPGIFVELERTRHVHVVEAMIDELETKIFELDFHADETERSQTSGAERRNQEKRTAYLDTVYLRNGLIGWSAQLSRMAQHAEGLENSAFALRNVLEATCPSPRPRRQPANEDANLELSMVFDNQEHLDNSCDLDITGDDAAPSSWVCVRQKDNTEQTKNQMRKTGRKIKERLQAIIDEYDDKIRDCTMRVDGMAMATQWVKVPSFLQISNL